MPSLLQKVQTLISANMHGLVDRALEANSIKVVDEHIRQVESNLGALEDSAATVGGTVRTLKRKYEEFAAAAEKLDRDIDTLILRGRDDLAAAAQAELNTKQQLSQDYYEQWQTQDGQYKQMLDMRLKLESRLTTIKSEREHLIALIELAEAKKVTTKTIKSLDQLASIGDADVTALTDQIDEAVRGGEIERQLDERKRRLGVSGGGSGDAASS